MDIKQAELEVEKRISIPEYFNKYIQPLKPGVTKISESELRTCCPFHDERDPSFGWWQQKRRFHCFGCGVSGNVIRLHQLRCRRFEGRKIDYEDALKELVGMYHLWEIDDVTDALNSKTKTKAQQLRESFNKTYESGFSKDALTLVKYEKLQKDIMKISDVDRRIKLFNELDMMTALVMSRVVENN